VFVPRVLPDELDLRIRIWRLLAWKRLVLDGWRVLGLHA
jgi:hypothetical protein